MMALVREPDSFFELRAAHLQHGDAQQPDAEHQDCDHDLDERDAVDAPARYPLIHPLPPPLGRTLSGTLKDRQRFVPRQAGTDQRSEKADRRHPPVRDPVFTVAVAPWPRPHLKGASP